MFTACGHTHAFGEWAVKTEATCTADGLQERVCECGEKEVKEIKAQGHNFAKATCTSPKTCKICDATEGTVAEHQFKGEMPCSICGEKNPRVEKIATALKSIKGYPTFISINKGLISNNYELFRMTGNYTYYSDVCKYTSEIIEYLKTVVNKLEDYTEYSSFIKMMVEDSKECIFSAPIPPVAYSTSTARSYISKCDTFATKADRIFFYYDNLCSEYGVN
jgi:hypothetical protein